MSYDDLEFDDGEDFDELLEASLATWAQVLPGYTPRDGHPEVAMYAEFLRREVETRALVKEHGAEIYRDFGREVHRLAPRDGTPATGTVVLTVADDAGVTVDAGVVLGWPSPSGELLVFRTLLPVTVPPGSTASPGVQVVADEPGVAGNDLPAGPLDVIDAPGFVRGATATGPSGQGTDAEDDAAYRDRLSDEVALLSRIPRTEADYAVAARSTPGVHRALALANYNPLDDTDGNEATVALSAVSPDGRPVPAEVRAALLARLQGTRQRDTNFIVRYFEPTYTLIDIAFHAQATPGSDPAEVEAAAEQAARAVIDPAVYGGGDRRPPVWEPRPLVSIFDVATAIGRVPGVRSVLDLRLNGGRADVQLLGRAPLPSPDSTVNGVVTA